MAIEVVMPQMGESIAEGTITKWLVQVGETVEREAEGFHARVIQHECDHLDGILYPMRIEDMSQFGFVDELGKQPPPQAYDEEEEVSDRGYGRSWLYPSPVSPSCDRSDRLAQDSHRWKTPAPTEREF